MLGMLDSSNMILKSNNKEAIRIQSNGQIFINEANDYNADVQIKGATLFKGVHQPYTSDELILNAFYWEPRKSALIIGNEMTPLFEDTLGRYSFSGGKLSKANSYSFAWGDSCIASGNNAVVFGAKSIASPIGLNKGGTAVSLGVNNEIAFKRSVAIGRNLRIINAGGANVAIGSYSDITDGGGMITVGNHIDNSGRSSFMIGNYLKSTGGLASPTAYCLLIGDNSTTSYLENLDSPNYQLLMRFDGGIVIYSDSLATTGVVLYSGSGSWAMLSDINRKENIETCKWDYKNSSSLNNSNVYLWNYMAQSENIIHLGIMAQEFNSMFHFKEDQKSISAVDMDGITLMGIKYLINQIEYDNDNLTLVENQFKELKAKQKVIKSLLLELEKKKKGGAP
jgi:hypothetical protein